MDEDTKKPKKLAVRRLDWRAIARDALFYGAAYAFGALLDRSAPHAAALGLGAVAPMLAAAFHVYAVALGIVHWTTPAHGA